MNISGLLNGPNNILDSKIPLNAVDEITLTCVDVADISKLNNIKNTYKNYKVPIFDNQIKIKFTITSNKFGREMLETPREKWQDQQFEARVIIRKYQFVSRFPENKGEIIHGLKFNLEHINLKN
jgi:hypothetical protein